jgi:hypothetical protein
MLHAYFYTICLVFRYTLWHFYAFSGTNLLTSRHSASSLFSAIFVFQKSYTENILRIGWNKSRSSYFSRHERSPKQRRRGTKGRPHPPWREPPPGRARAWCGPLVHLPTSPFRLYILLNEKTLSRINFPKNILQAVAVIDARLGGSRSSSRHLAGEGNHHRRPSSSSFLPPEWCVSSLP